MSRPELTLYSSHDFALLNQICVCRDEKKRQMGQSHSLNSSPLLAIPVGDAI